jgi:hypothetical protein
LGIWSVLSGVICILLSAKIFLQLIFK